jgi:putative ABC transport system permease protein
MTLTHLISKNIKGLRYKYVTFLLSSILSVTIFYLFASFVMHPNVAYGYQLHAERVQKGLVACEVIVVAFSFFFVWYSSSAFIRSRSREFGLVTVLGASKKQLSKMIFRESMLIGEAAIGAGVILGTLLLRLFLSAMSVMLQVDSPIEFALVPWAIVLTLAGYSALFAVVAIINICTLKFGRIIQMVKESQKARKPPVFSPVLGIVSVLCLGVGYYLAWTTEGRTVVFRILPVTGIVSVGTYFLFTQISTGVLRFLRRNKGLYYRNINLLTVAELGFKIQDNARVLCTTAILSAVMITSVGTLNIGSQLLVEMRETQYPRALSIAIRGTASLPELAEEIEREFESDGLKIESGLVFPGVMFEYREKGVYRDPLICEEDYNQWAIQNGAPYLDVLPGHGVWVREYPWDSEYPTTVWGHLESRSPYRGQDPDKDKMSFVVDDEILMPIMNVPYSRVLVVDAGEMDTLFELAAPRDKMVIASYEISNWTRSFDAVKRIRTSLTKQAEQADFEILDFSSRVEPYQETRQSRSLTMFIALFVTVLFSLGTGSMLHFRLFTDLEEDRARFLSMRRLGLSWHEIKSIVTRQAAMLFFAPFAVGIIHSVFAFKALSGCIVGDDSIGKSVIVQLTVRYAAVPIGIFLALQVMYFLISRNAYMGAIVSKESDYR